MHKITKVKLRQEAKARRETVTEREPKANALITHFPLDAFKGSMFALYWPIGTEIDVRPFMRALFDAGEQLCLPKTHTEKKALTFHSWEPDIWMKAGPFGTMEPAQVSAGRRPDFVFLPMLGFDKAGARLGYGGGYYDRAFKTLREGRPSAQTELHMGARKVFACGVGFDEQKMPHIPLESHDVSLDAVLTPSGFHVFHAGDRPNKS